MPVTSVSKVECIQGGFESKGQRSGNLEYIAITNDEDPDFYSVISQSIANFGVPDIGSYWNWNGISDANFKVSSIEASIIDVKTHWKISVTYSVDSNGENEVAPWDREPSIEFDGIVYQKPVIRDVFGKALTFSNGEYPNQPFEIDDSRSVIIYSRAYRGFDAAFAEDYRDSINLDPYLGFRPGRLKVARFTGSYQTESQYKYWQVSIELHINREGWLLEYLDRGTFVLGPNGPVNGIDENGNVVPENLDGNGGGLPEGQDPVFLVRRVLKERRFSRLPIRLSDFYGRRVSLLPIVVIPPPPTFPT